ncbi:MAG: Cache 3/Cache 2 fusion domain-containing protein [Anaerolineae bacterium]|nr:Cache 3/Cache 2 fusion domain-containing protein [Anaerolineae bacterium]
MNKLVNWLQGSIYRAILLAFILVSVIPIVLISLLFTRQSMEALTRQMEENLQLLAQSKAEEIDLKLDEVMHSTLIAAHLTAEALQTPTDPARLSENLTHYRPDSRQIVGLDMYYLEQGGKAVFGTDLSNVYWPHELAADTAVARQIVQTESLDTAFAAIKSVSPDTQWIYMTTPEGMMRLYPWASNDHYPDNWDPREIIFYTVADPENNPQLTPQWTPPYVDYAGAGWMVTASTPILGNNGEFLGVMSHDITIDSLKQIALEISVLGGVGSGFLIDNEGKVIAHPAYQDESASKGTQEDVNLLYQGSDNYVSLIQQMVSGQQGLGYYTDEAGESLLVYAPVPNTGWSLGVSIPRENVIAPAITMRNRAIVVTAVMVATAVLLAVFLTRLIHQPLIQLLQGVQQVADAHKADEIQVNSFAEFKRLAQAFNEMASHVWERESQLKAKVAEMRIEIDTQRKQQRVDSIVETDFFKRLEANANRLRADVRNATQAHPSNVKSAPATD